MRHLLSLFPSPGHRPGHSRRRVANPPQRGSLRVSFMWVFRVSLRETNVTPVSPTFSPSLSHMFSHTFSHTFSPPLSHMFSPTFPPTFRRVCNPPASCCGFATRVIPVSYDGLRRMNAAPPIAFPFPGSQTRPQSAAGCKPAATWVFRVSLRETNVGVFV